MTTATVPGHFSDWLQAMHPRLSGFVDFRLPSNIVKDFSREGLRQFEDFLLSTWSDAAVFGRDADEDFKDGAVRYVGEGFLREFGGGWDFTENPRALFTGVPVIRVSAAAAVPHLPLPPAGRDPD